MITLKEFMEVTEHRITEGGSYTWNFEPNAYYLSYWNGDHNGHSLNIVFNTKTQEVYLVEVCDYKNDRAYRLINPDYLDNPEVNDNQEAWDDTNWTNLDVDDDWIQKALAIVNSEDYDTRISVPVEFSDEELLKYMKLAHERDITFNQLVEEALREAIAEVKRDPEGFKARTERWKQENDIA